MNNNLLSLNLLENAMDSFKESISYFIRAEYEEESRYYKFSILLLAHSAELLLKEILKESHPLLVYRDIDDIKINKIESAHTVNLEKALNRISLIGIEIPEKIVKKINNLYRERNKIQHYEVKLNAGEASKIVSESIVAIHYLLEEILKQNLEDYLEEETIDEVREIETLYFSYLKHAEETIKSRNLSYLKYELFPNRKFKVPCPSCGEKLLVEEKTGIKCYFCSRKYINIEDCFENDKEHNYISELFVQELNKRRRSGKYVIDYCKSCGIDNCFYDENKDSWFCVSCFSYYNNTPCQNCGNPTLHKLVGGYINDDMEIDYEYICDSCADDSDRYIEVRDWE